MDNKPCEEGKMYTIEDIIELDPCEEYTEERLKELWAGREALSRREILELDIDIDDKNWVVPQLVSTEVVVKWAHLCAHEAKKHAATVVNAAAAAARSAGSAGYAHAAAANTRYAAANPRYAAEYAGYAADHAADAAAARYAFAAEYAARSAALSAADAAAARYAAAARSAADTADVSYASAYASYAWGKTHKTELYRLLSHLCDMAE